MNRTFAFVPLLLMGLPVEPWFGNVYEFRFDGGYTYSHYNKVQNAHPGLSHPSNDQLLAFDLGLTAGETWDADVAVEFTHTPRQAWGLRSGAIQARKLWLDDILGDPVSLTTGLNMRGVSNHSVKDVSSPYHYHFNIELNSAVGKEWDNGASWRFRTFAFAGVGMANQGWPWLRALAAFKWNSHDESQYTIFAESYLGFGSQREIDIDHFHGYAKVHHQSFDLGFCYSYMLPLWGSFNFEYKHRFYAFSFPANANFFTVSYFLPFSFF